MACNIYKMSMMLALVIVFGTFAYNFSQTGTITGGAVIKYAYYDADGDGYGNPDAYITTPYNLPEGYVPFGTDCNDTDTNIHPGAIETCKPGVDNDCDGKLDLEENAYLCRTAN